MQKNLCAFIIFLSSLFLLESCSGFNNSVRFYIEKNELTVFYNMSAPENGNGLKSSPFNKMSDALQKIVELKELFPEKSEFKIQILSSQFNAFSIPENFPSVKIIISGPQDKSKVFVSTFDNFRSIYNKTENVTVCLENLIISESPVIFHNGNCEVKNCDFVDVIIKPINSKGGALRIDSKNSSLIIENVNFINCRNEIESKNGGAIFFNGRKFYGKNINISYCSAISYGGTKTHGGGIFIENNCNVILKNVSISNCAAEFGSCLSYPKNAFIQMENCKIENNLVEIF